MAEAGAAAGAPQPQQKTWRQRQEQASMVELGRAEALLRRKEPATRLPGLAAFVKGRYEGFGYAGSCGAGVLQQVVATIADMRFDPALFTRVTQPTGRVAYGSLMRPGDYIIFLAAEVLMIFYQRRFLQLDTQSRAGTHTPMLYESEEKELADIAERAQRVLLRLAGNFGATLGDAAGRLAGPTAQGAVSVLDLGDGLRVPADVLVATQLDEYGLHPKQAAFLMHSVLAWASKDATQCAPLAAFAAQQFLASANALVALATNPRGRVLDAQQAAAAAAASTDVAVSTFHGGNPAVAAGRAANGAGVGQEQQQQAAPDEAAVRREIANLSACLQ